MIKSLDWSLLVALLGLGVSGVALWQSQSAKRLAGRSALAPYVRPHLEKAREYLGTIVAKGGAESLEVIKETGEIARRLKELEPGVSDSYGSSFTPFSSR